MSSNSILFKRLLPRPVVYVFLVMAVAILIALALPAYQDYTIRTKVGESFSIAAFSKNMINEYCASFPGAKNIDFRYFPEFVATHGNRKYIKAVEVTGDCNTNTIRVWTQNTGSSVDTVLDLRGTARPEGTVDFKCSLVIGNPADVPLACREFRFGVRESIAALEPEPQWNFWAERGGIAVNTLQHDKVYDLKFDFSAFDYRTILQIIGSPLSSAVTNSPAITELVDAIDKAQIEFANLGHPDSGVLKLWVKPVIFGDNLSFHAGAGKARQITIDLSRLHEPSISRSSMSLSHLSQSLSAINDGDESFQPLNVEVLAKSDGCGAVALSVWNENRNKPLDYVIQPLVIGETGCVFKSKPDTLAGRMLTMSPGMSDKRANVALHIFEMGIDSEELSVSVLVVGDPQGQGNQLFSWQLAESVSAYINHKDLFLQHLKNAKQKTPIDLTVVSESLKNAIFQGSNSHDNEIAEEARKAFDSFLSSHPSPTLFARLVDSSGISLFLPLGLMETATGEPLGRKAKIIQPLVKEDFENPRCISNWTVVIPKFLQGVTEDTHLELISPLRSPQMQHIHEWVQFVNYLEDRNSSPTDSPEGLLILTHHHEGAIWFNRDIGSVSRSALKREFQDGSVALLISCEGGKIDDPFKSLSWVRALEGANIDALILSPFEVNAVYAARFAVQFAEQINQARGGESLYELYAATIQTLETDTDAKDENVFPYEFLVAGDGDITLCEVEGSD